MMSSTDSRQNMHVLVVDPQPSVVRTLTESLRPSGFEVQGATSREEALELAAMQAFHAIIFDIDLIGERLRDLIAAARTRSAGVRMVATATSGSLSGAIEAIRAGCLDYLLKPVSLNKLSAALTQSQDQAQDQARPQKQIQAAAGSPPDFLGASREIVKVEQIVSRYARSDAPVLITGESGTGKEVCAQALHARSRRADGPFVAINCAALPKDLLESELFGHVKGAFSGATTDRAGAAVSAHGGTLFLDEIGELDISLQAKLLRFLQTGMVRSVGSDKLKALSVRIIAATNRCLRTEIREGRFREDLYYRLDVLAIRMPALKDRGQDVLDLATHFIRLFGELEARPDCRLDLCARQALVEHGWAGNVRELQNRIRRALVLAPSSDIKAEHLFPDLEETGFSPEPPPAHRDVAPSAATSLVRRFQLTVMQPLSEIEREVIEAVVAECGGNLTRAAQILQVSPSTIYRKREAWAQRETDESEPAGSHCVEPIGFGMREARQARAC